MKRATIFGMGAIGTSLASDWHEQPPRSWALTAVCARPRQAANLRKLLGPEIRIVEDLEDILALSPDAVIEAAGQASARLVAGRILRSGSDLYLLSSGILADAALFNDLVRAAEEGNSSIVIPAGALGGFDGLMTLGRLKPAAVTYRSTKPARAWMQTPAEAQFDLAALTDKTVIFRGTAREAAQAFPQNANLAASVALAGIGFDRTMVELIADPHSSHNRAEIEARTSNCELRVEMASVAESRNPKSSAIVRTSVLAALERSVSRVRLG